MKCLSIYHNCCEPIDIVAMQSERVAYERDIF